MAALALCWCAQASHCGHFSCWRAQAEGTWVSVVVAHGLSCSIECGIFPTALTGKFLTTRPPGKLLYLFYRSVFNQGRFCPQETCGKVWRCFCSSRCRERGGCYWHLMDRGQGCCWTPYKVGFQQRNYPSKIVSGAEVKKPLQTKKLRFKGIAYPRSHGYCGRQKMTPQIYGRGGNDNPLQHSCLGNPMNREAWQAAVHRATKTQTQLSTSTIGGKGELKLEMEIRLLIHGS